jgi:hypothetical protein
MRSGRERVQLCAGLSALVRYDKLRRRHRSSFEAAHYPKTERAGREANLHVLDCAQGATQSYDNPPVTYYLMYGTRGRRQPR